MRHSQPVSLAGLEVSKTNIIRRNRLLPIRLRELPRAVSAIDEDEERLLDE
jgi:hypothetical protein